MRRLLVGPVAALLLAAGACSDDDGAGSEADDTTSTASTLATRPLTEEETLALDADVLGSDWTTQPFRPPVAEEDEARIEACLGREGADEHEVSERFSDRFVRDQGEALATVREVDDPDVAAADLEARRTNGPDCLAELYGDQVESQVAGAGTTAEVDANVIPLPGADDALRIRLTLVLRSDEGTIPTQYLDLVFAVEGVHEMSLTFRNSVSPVPDDLQVRLLEAARDAI